MNILKSIDKITLSGSDLFDLFKEHYEYDKWHNIEKGSCIQAFQIEGLKIGHDVDLDWNIKMRYVENKGFFACIFCELICFFGGQQIEWEFDKSLPDIENKITHYIEQDFKE